jgi:hypothetical protein
MTARHPIWERDLISDARGELLELLDEAKKAPGSELNPLGFNKGINDQWRL